MSNQIFGLDAPVVFALTKTRLGICRGITSVLCLKRVLQTHRLCIGRVKYR